jgi:hypothetical protein
MKRYLDRLRVQAEENPILALGAGAVAITALSKLISAGTEARNSRSWAKEVDRRRMNDSRR